MLWLSIWRWCTGAEAGGWVPAQNTIWILRSCQTTTHTHTHMRTHAHNRMCVPDHPRSQRPAGSEVMSRHCGCTDNTHTKMHINTHVFWAAKLYSLPLKPHLNTNQTHTLKHTFLLGQWEWNHVIVFVCILFDPEGRKWSKKGIDDKSINHRKHLMLIKRHG